LRDRDQKTGRRHVDVEVCPDVCDEPLSVAHVCDAERQRGDKRCPKFGERGRRFGAWKQFV
jgi:hypothetical protein